MQVSTEIGMVFVKCFRPTVKIAKTVMNIKTRFLLVDLY